MSLVERLAAKHLAIMESGGFPGVETFEMYRFLLNAIADELEARQVQQNDRYEWPSNPIRWLREEAAPISEQRISNPAGTHER